MSKLMFDFDQALVIAKYAQGIQSGARDYAESGVRKGTFRLEDSAYVAESALLDAWGQGCVEWRYECALRAMDVYYVDQQLALIFEELDEGYLGVFDYEVAEEVGEAMAKHVFAAGAHTTAFGTTLVQYATTALIRATLQYVEGNDAEAKLRVAAMLAEKWPKAFAALGEAS